MVVAEAPRWIRTFAYQEEFEPQYLLENGRKDLPFPKGTKHKQVGALDLADIFEALVLIDGGNTDREPYHIDSAETRKIVLGRLMDADTLAILISRANHDTDSADQTLWPMGESSNRYVAALESLRPIDYQELGQNIARSIMLETHTAALQFLEQEKEELNEPIPLFEGFTNPLKKKSVRDGKSLSLTTARFTEGWVNKALRPGVGDSCPLLYEQNSTTWRGLVVILNIRSAKLQFPVVLNGFSFRPDDLNYFEADFLDIYSGMQGEFGTEMDFRWRQIQTVAAEHVARVVRNGGELKPTLVANINSLPNPGCMVVNVRRTFDTESLQLNETPYMFENGARQELGQWIDDFGHARHAHRDQVDQLCSQMQQSRLQGWS